VLVVEAVAAVHPREHDLICGVAAARGAVGDVDGRCRGKVGAGSGDAVLDSTTDGGLKVVAGVVSIEEVTWPRPGCAAVERLDHLDLALSGRRRIEGELVVEHVDHTFGVDTHRAAGAAKPIGTVDAVGGRCDLRWILERFWRTSEKTSTSQS
jgi:hypothetical protein